MPRVAVSVVPSAPSSPTGAAATPRPRRRQAGRGLGLVLGFATAFLGLPGCRNTTTDRSLKWVEPDAAIKTMTGKQGAFGIGGVPDGVWVDARDERSYAKSHIPNAISIPFPRVDEMYPTIRDREIIIVYDSDYDDIVAKAASKRMLELGHKDVYTLRGGIRAWERDGNPVVTGE
jgi:rhodanese-related sulfurtransferase